MYCCLQTPIIENFSTLKQQNSIKLVFFICKALYTYKVAKLQESFVCSMTNTVPAVTKSSAESTLEGQPFYSFLYVLTTASLDQDNAIVHKLVLCEKYDDSIVSRSQP